MQKQTKTSVFQNSDGTWGHLTKTVNPLIYTIEYGRRTGFSSREEAEESYQRSLTSYQDQLSKLKKERDMPFTFSEYLDYWLNDVCAQGSNGSRTLVQKQWTINLIIQPHLHKDILLGCVTPDYLNKVLESCQAYCCNGGYYAYKLLHSALKTRPRKQLSSGYGFPADPALSGASRKSGFLYPGTASHIPDCRFQFQPLPGDSTGSFLRPDTRGNPRTEVFGFQATGTDHHNPEDLYLERFREELPVKKTGRDQTEPKLKNSVFFIFGTFCPAERKQETPDKISISYRL